MIGPWPCAYVDPVFTSQSCDVSISTSTRSTKLSVFLVLMLRLMSTQFSLAYTCASAYACVLVKTRLKGGVARDDSQRLFLGQHRVAMMEQCCNHSKQCRNNAATLCCAKNHRCELS